MRAAAGRISQDKFLAAIGEIAGLDDGGPSVDARLVRDLGMDSVALAEVATFLIVDLGVDSVAETLDTRDWSEVTVAELYAEYRGA